MNHWLKTNLYLICIALFICAFFWVGDVHSYLDQHYWHFDHVERGEVLKASFVGVLLSWFIALAVSMLPYMLTGALIYHFWLKEYNEEKDANAKLYDAKKACNLYISTNVSASADTPN